MLLRKRSPSGPVVGFVRQYHYREQSFRLGVPPIVLPARNDQFLELYLGDRTEVITYPATHRVLSPQSVVVGPQSNGRIELFLSGTVRTFTIHFEPTGFYALFGAPMAELAGKGEDASSVLGAIVGHLRGRIGELKDFSDMVNAVEEFLTPFAIRARVTSSTDRAILVTIRRMAAKRGQLRIDELVAKSELGHRQFERKFKQMVGISPKHFMKVDRFQYALSLRSSNPEWSWGRVSAESGYHDQMHLVHDFKSLGGAAPTTLMAAIDQG